MLQDLRNVTFTGFQVPITQKWPTGAETNVGSWKQPAVGRSGAQSRKPPSMSKKCDTLTVGFSPSSEQGACESLVYQNANSTPSTTASTSEQLIIEPESLFESKTSECFSVFLSKGNFLQVSDVELVMSHQLCQSLQPLGTWQKCISNLEMAPDPGMQKVFDWPIVNCSCILKAFPCNNASLSLVRELLGLGTSQLFIHDTIATTVS